MFQRLLDAWFGDHGEGERRIQMSRLDSEEQLLRGLLDCLEALEDPKQDVVFMPEGLVHDKQRANEEILYLMRSHVSTLLSFNEDHYLDIGRNAR